MPEVRRRCMFRLCSVRSRKTTGRDSTTDVGILLIPRAAAAVRGGVRRPGLFQDCSLRRMSSTTSLTTWSAAAAWIMALIPRARVILLTG